MRITLSLDDDFAAKLQEQNPAQADERQGDRHDCLRRGLEASSEAKLAAPFSVEPRPMGLRAGFDLDDIGGLLDLLDGPVRR